ncbi:acyltransferase family protein [Terriglobus roseus]|uniref:Predicted acyltransferase n=1 Tax=Terriglobus roseus TaxID=392734 RepID=A0A1G7QSH5_9BACT|nr:heparan-alpha-glucosaminide N-acetyltransferase domain-containing protein [Terriglobus roseus]SDG01465.1 Predicted acyltransferase [Terriglobus roseus]
MPVNAATADPDFARTPDSDIVRTATVEAPRTERLLSVDLLRGLTIAVMILVNNQPGNKGFFELRHAQWNGFTLTDLVFPTFLFLVGLSVVLSMAARLAKGASRRTLFLHTLRRSAILVFFGLIVNTFPFQHLDSIRFYGVLQRTAICYLIVGTLCLLRSGWKDKAVIAIACLISYWLLMRYVPVPGCGIPTHEIPINDPNCNLTSYIDRAIFAPQHLYQRVRDPEGLLSTLPAISTALYGVLAGMWLRTKRSNACKAAGIAVAGVVLVSSGLLWSIVFPLNKKLWTSSFSLLAGGLSLLLLAASVYIIDAKRWGRSGLAANEAPAIYKPLMVFGTNSILAYMVSELLPPIFSQVKSADGNILRTLHYKLDWLIPGHGWPELCYGLIAVLVTWLIVLPFYRKRIFLRV